MMNRSKWIQAAVLSLSSAALAACGGTGGGDEGEARTAPGAFGLIEFAADPLETPAAGANGFHVTLRELESEEPFVGAALHVGAVMPSMGHEAPDSILIEEVGGGAYEALNIVFAMPGTWELRCRASRGDVVDEAAFRYEVR